MRLFSIVFFSLLLGLGSASAQFVSSGSGTGQRGGDQGLSDAMSIAQTVGYDSDEDFENAQEQGYGLTEEDAEIWDYASNGLYDETCQEVFGNNCDDVPSDLFKDLVPTIEISEDLGFTNLQDMANYVEGVEEFGGNNDDAAKCKKKGYAAKEAELRLCMMSTSDDENVEACREKMGLSAGEPGDCSDLSKDDYVAVSNNLPPKIVTPADWVPQLTFNNVGANAKLISVLRATDPDGDKLTWSLQSASNSIFKVDAGNGDVLLDAQGGDDIPNKADITVLVSDGFLSDTITISMNFEYSSGDENDTSTASDNRPPQIIVPEGFIPGNIGDGVEQGQDIVVGLEGKDPDGDKLIWSITDNSSNNTFSIDSDTGQVSLKCASGPIRPEPTCFWMESKRPYCWVPAEIGFYRGGGKQQCFELDSCDGGLGGSSGGCYKWAYSESSKRIDWNGGKESETTKPISEHSFIIQLSDGELTDTKRITVPILTNKNPEDASVEVSMNRPPEIMLPADWVPSPVADGAELGTSVVSVLAARDPDGDELTWSIAAISSDLFSINTETGRLTLSQAGVDLLQSSERPASVTVTARVSDGELTDEEELTIKIEAKRVNNPPVITVPSGFASEEFSPYPSGAVSLGSLIGEDPDDDPLTWSLLEGDPSIFSINTATGALSFTALGSDDQLACVASNSSDGNSGGAAVRAATSQNRGIISTSSSVVQDHGNSDFRTARKGGGGSFTTTRKYHVVLERENHRGGSFTTEAREPRSYLVGAGSQSIQVPGLSSATINSNSNPINSYLVFQNNGDIDLSNTNGQVTFQNPIIGIYYTDAGFDKTVTRLGKPNALYTRMSQRDKLGLENGKDIAWIDPVDRRKLNMRSRTNKIGDFIRVITASSSGGGVDQDDKDPIGPDTCSAQLRVELSDGQATDEATIKVSFSDPNRKPDVFGPMDWVPSIISNSKKTGDQVINALAARDPDGDRLIWTLEGANANLFSIGKFDGKISLSQGYEDADTLPTKANVIVRVSDGKLTDTLALNIPLEAKVEKGTMTANAGTNGSFQFVSGNVQNIFNQDYTIMARIYHGAGGYKSRYYSWWPKRGWKTSASKETIFFYGGNDNVGRKVRSGISLHVVDDSIRLQLGTDYNYLETRTKLAKNRWHTVMFVVDADQRRQTSKYSWPVKIFLNGQKLGVNDFKTGAKNRGYAAILNATYAGLGIAGKWKEQNDSRRPWARHLPLRNTSFIHEVSIWQGDKSASANAIYNSNRDVQDYSAIGAGKPRYSWKPALWGKSSTSDGKGTLTLANLANGAAANGGPLAGNGVSRLDGDMHLYPGRFGVSNGAAKAYTDWRGRSPQTTWHQGMSYYFDLIKSNGQRNWQSTYDKNSGSDIEAFTSQEMAGKSKLLN